MQAQTLDASSSTSGSVSNSACVVMDYLSQPSPSSGPPLLSASWSPPLFWGTTQVALAEPVPALGVVEPGEDDLLLQPANAITKTNAATQRMTSGCFISRLPFACARRARLTCPTTRAAVRWFTQCPVFAGTFLAATAWQTRARR